MASPFILAVQKSPAVALTEDEGAGDSPSPVEAAAEITRRETEAAASDNLGVPPALDRVALARAVVSNHAAHAFTELLRGELRESNLQMMTRR